MDWIIWLGNTPEQKQAVHHPASVVHHAPSPPDQLQPLVQGQSYLSPVIKEVIIMQDCSYYNSSRQLS